MNIYPVSLYRVIAVLGLVALGATAASCYQPSAWRAWATAQEEKHRLAELTLICTEQAALRQQLVEDLAAGRIGLGTAIDIKMRLIADQAEFRTIIRHHYPAPTDEESIAGNLLGRVESLLASNTAAQPEAAARLGREYLDLFGHRPPPRATPPGWLSRSLSGNVP